MLVPSCCPPQLAAFALERPDTGALAIHRLNARCARRGCGAPAPFTQRLLSRGTGPGSGSGGDNGGGDDGPLVLVGDAESYRPACAAHHSPHAIHVDAETALAQWESPPPARFTT
jgi:hypothetical protein